MEASQKIQKYFDLQAAKWDENFLSAYDRCRKVFEIDKFKNIFNCAKILDIGCGTGVFEFVAVKEHPKHIDAIDVSQKMIEVAKSKFWDNPDISFKCLDILNYKNFNQSIIQNNTCSCNIDFLNPPYDVVVMYNVYPHIMDKNLLVDRVYALLKQDGRFIVAHGSSAQVINTRHDNIPSGISNTLNSAKDESKRWTKNFIIDAVEDNNKMYYFTGIKK